MRGLNDRERATLLASGSGTWVTEETRGDVYDAIERRLMRLVETAPRRPGRRCFRTEVTDLGHLALRIASVVDM